MKKIMIFTMILMPLLVLAMLFLTGNVVSYSTYLYVERIEFVEDSVVLNKQTDEQVSKQLTVNVFPMLANNKEVEFWSTDNSVVTIDSKGVVTSVDFGETYIYAKSKENSTRTASCKVLVTSDHVHRVWIENPIDELYVSQSHSLIANYAPKEAKDVELNFKSSNPSVLSVSSTGELRALGKGSATITLELKSDPSIKYSFDVISRYEIKDIWIDSSPVTSGLSEFTFPEIQILPAEADEPVTYWSQNKDIAEVDSSGRISFKKAGTVEICAKVDNFSKVVSKTYTSTFGYFTNVSFESDNPKVIDFEDWKDEDLILKYTYSPLNANFDNLELLSLNTDVIDVQNGKLKVVGGGSVTIKLVAKTSISQTVEATWILQVNRKAESLDFDLNDFSYTSLKSVSLNVSKTPQDATESITYSVSNTQIAQVENGVLTFSTFAINNKFGKVQITAQTLSGASKTITIIYLDESIEKIYIDSEAEFNFVMPKTSEAQRSFAFVIADENITDINLVLASGADAISQNGHIFTLLGKGQAQVDVYLNGSNAKQKSLSIDIVRKVEAINNLKITAMWQDKNAQVFSANDVIYSSSKTFKFEYDLFPQNTTIQVANAQVDGDIASVEGNVVTFNSAGIITLILSADDAIQTIDLQSTCLLLDDNTTVGSSLTISKGESVSIWSIINISPQNASPQNVLWNTDDLAISISDEGDVLGLNGGNATIQVTLKTTKGDIIKQISVYVKEKAQSLAVVGDSYLFTQNNTLNISNKFVTLPQTANEDIDVTFGVEDDEIASISANGDVTFVTAGMCSIWAKLPNQAVAKISVVYTGNEIVLSGANEYNVLHGTKVIIRPSSETLHTAVYNQDFVSNSSSITITSGVFATILGDGTVTFNNETYTVTCVNKIQTISLLPSEDDVDDETDKYVTALSSLQLTTSVMGTQSQFIIKCLSVDNENVAQIDEYGMLSFSSAGEVTVTLSCQYTSDVYGASGLKAIESIVVQSTNGQMLSISALDGGSFTHFIDEQNALNNIINVASLLKPYPSQVVLSSSNVKLQINMGSASANGLYLTFTKGGNVEVDVQIRIGDEFENGTNLSFEVYRSASAIMLDGEIISDGDVICVHKSTAFINPQAYPQDANINNQIAWESTSNNGVADVDYDKNSIAFKKANEQLQIIFTLGEGANAKQFVVYFETTRITYEVDVDSTNYVVPMGEPFTFISANGELENFGVQFDSSLDISLLEDDVYIANSSRVGRVDIHYGDISKTVTFISTTNFQDVQNVTIADVDMYGEQKNINVQKDELSLTTASTLVSIDYTIPEGYDKFGNQISYTLSTNSAIAQITGNNTVQFSNAGSATITLKVEYQDVYKTNIVTYSFAVQSTYGKVIQFSINQQSYSYIYDDMTEVQKQIDLTEGLVRIAPIYGAVQSPSYQSQNSSIISVQNGVASVLGSGKTMVNVTWGTMTLPITFTIDKYVDGINIIQGNKDVCQVVTRLSTYNIEYSLVVNDSSKAPTLTDITFSTTSPNCSVSNTGVVTMNDINTKCQVVLSAQGGACATLTIIRVADNVNIIDVNALTTSTVIKKDVVYILDMQFGKVFVDINTFGTNLQVVNSDINTFKGLLGTERTSILLTNEQTIYATITEDVTSILFKEDELGDNYITADGEEGRAIDLISSYGAYIYPATARSEEGEYVIEYSIDNPEIAYVQDGFLIFKQMGKVKIKFEAGGVGAYRSIESTYGYAKYVQFKDSERLVLNYKDQEFTLPSDFYEVYPKGATKADIKLTSLKADTFVVQGNKLVFTGAGSAYLQLSYKQDATSEPKTITREIYIVNKASGISFYDGVYKTGYMVTNKVKDVTMPLNYVLEADGDLSPHELTFTSSNQGVATVNNGALQFVGNGVTQITLKIRDLLDAPDSFYAEATLVVVNNKDYNIIAVTDNIDVVIENDDQSTNILYPLPNSSVNEFSFEVLTGTNVLSVDPNYGIIQKYSGGEASIKITAEGQNSNNWTKTVSVYVHKKTEINLLQSSAKTAQSSYLLQATLSPTDSFARKKISLISSNTSVAVVDTNSIDMASSITQQISLISPGRATITIRVMYNNDKVEAYKQFEIVTTYGLVESFDISKSSLSLYIGDTETITISNIQPADFIGTISLTSNNAEAYSCTVLNSTSFKVTAIQCGSGEIVVKYEWTETFFQKINVTILKYSENVEIKYDGKAITHLNTFVDSLELTAVVTPLDASNRSVTWVYSSNVTLDYCEQQNTVLITFNAYGTAEITANSIDGACGKTITITYLQYIDDFNVYSGDDLINSGDTIYLKFNQDSVNLSIEIIPNNVIYNSFDQDFTITCLHSEQTTITKQNSNTINIQAISNTTQASYFDTITISYKNGRIEKTVILIRDVVQAVDFGDHDNDLDSNYGLQSMRVFGNQSYYKLSSSDTSPIKNYYKMTVNVTPASAYNTLVWSFEAKGVSGVTITPQNGYVEIDFHAINSTVSSVNDIYENIFDNFTLKVIATNLANTISVSYTFHIVKGVNVFDADGFVNAGAEIVLHKNFGHNDQQSAIDQENSTYVKLEAYANKTTIYGNGYLVNYAYRNADTSAKLSGGSSLLGTAWAHTPITLTNAINVKIQGTNYSSSRDSDYLVELADPQKIAYCEIYNMYRAVELGSTNPLKVKNTLFRSFAHSAIILTNDTSADRKIYLENVIMYDVGYRAIELQGSHDFVYVSGIFDVYNFQNSSALKKVMGTNTSASLIISAAEDNNMAVKKLGENWANVVCVAVKEAKNRDEAIMFYQKDGSDIADGVPDVSYVEKFGYKAWATKNDHEYLKWENEYDESQSTSKKLVLNEEYLSGTSNKIKR